MPDKDPRQLLADLMHHADGAPAAGEAPEWDDFWTEIEAAVGPEPVISMTSDDEPMSAQDREAALYAAIEATVIEALYDAGICADDPMDEISLVPPIGFSGGRA